MSQDSPAESVLRGLIEAFDRADLAGMAPLLAEEGRFFITNATGGVDLVRGRHAFMANISALGVAAVRPSVAITQILCVAEDQAMAMVEVKAARKGRTLHNFAAYLARVENGQIVQMHMVEALPAQSDSFWKD